MKTESRDRSGRPVSQQASPGASRRHVERNDNPSLALGRGAVQALEARTDDDGGVGLWLAGENARLFPDETWPFLLKTGVGDEDLVAFAEHPGVRRALRAAVVQLYVALCDSPARRELLQVHGLAGEEREACPAAQALWWAYRCEKRAALGRIAGALVGPELGVLELREISRDLVLLFCRRG